MKRNVSHRVDASSRHRRRRARTASRARRRRRTRRRRRRCRARARRGCHHPTSHDSPIYPLQVCPPPSLGGCAAIRARERRRERRRVPSARSAGSRRERAFGRLNAMRLILRARNPSSTRVAQCRAARPTPRAQRNRIQNQCTREERPRANRESPRSRSGFETSRRFLLGGCTRRNYIGHADIHDRPRRLRLGLGVI